MDCCLSNVTSIESKSIFGKLKLKHSLARNLFSGSKMDYSRLDETSKVLSENVWNVQDLGPLGL